MIDKLFSALEKFTHLAMSDLVRSFVLIVAILMVRLTLQYLLTHNKRLSLDVKRQWTLYFRNIAFFLIVIGLILIWATEIRTLALSMAAAAVAVAVSLKELITCALTSIVRASSNSYALGDYIQVGRFRGRVTDINLLTTTLMEMGPANAFQYSGKTVAFPNSLLFTDPVIRLDSDWTYVAHTVEIPVPYAFPLDVAKHILNTIANEICAPHLVEARRYMRRLERRELADTPSVEPRISIVMMDEKYYKLLARIVIPQAELFYSEQDIIFRFMNEIQPLLPPPPPPPPAPSLHPDLQAWRDLHLPNPPL